MFPEPPFVLLEDRIGPARGGHLYSDISEVHVCRVAEGVQASLSAVERAATAGGHVAGWLAYECGAAFEPRLSQRAGPSEGEPLLWFGVFRHRETLKAAALDRLFAGRPPAAPIRRLRYDEDREAHVARVRRALELIAAGDLYQVNLTFPLRFNYGGDPLALYAALRARQPVAHGGVVATGDAWLLSVSPELFVEVKGEEATTRPMKGTAPRGRDPAADAAKLADLRVDPKQQAENLMIVDLLRNDLSRVCRPGSVRVPDLFTPETYPTLHTLTSTVTGRLLPGTTLYDLLRALFPCGSVVGAPKIRAAEVIAELEPVRRGVYTGAIGALSPTGDLRFNVAIRTATLRDGQGDYGVGGGVVADSDPDAEYEEALLKGRLLSDLAEDFQLIETLGWAPGGFVRLGRHLARLRSSASKLGFRCDAAALEARLQAEARSWRSLAPRRVRIRLRRNGGFEISSEAIEVPALARRKLVIAPGRLDAADPFLRHKTSFRDRHETAFAWALAAQADEAVLLNRDGWVADASRASIFVRRADRLVTPPVEDGALPGVLRAMLLEQGEAVIERLSPADLAAGDVYVGSSLRGLQPATLQLTEETV
ncbi:para-aminobenzoate synthase, component I [Phenylobacterium zucineum HLK1]|uniref:Probable branched-chain-amino-acid aminotransferase n=1 Tax=Phenylobacterium zucineum (strain HLK1) TaxID=450851 RepID=B4RFY7_PHEZH|nr:aminodeoxychorismate synthase component I [Phenylobacterium zucineum]ACG78800.1 para-aminobenzoate synthase, component I [Phenylobacterium zucineum HLK1]